MVDLKRYNKTSEEWFKLSEGPKLFKGSFSNIILAMQEPQSNSVEKNNSCNLDDEWFICMIKKK